MFLDAMREAGIACFNALECVTLSSIFCHTGDCDYISSIAKCTKGYPPPPPENWPCAGDYRSLEMDSEEGGSLADEY